MRRSVWEVMLQWRPFGREACRDLPARPAAPPAPGRPSRTARRRRRAPCRRCGSPSLERVILVGIARTFDPDPLPVGAAGGFRSVLIHSVGVGLASFMPAPALGYRHWPWRGRGRSDGAACSRPLRAPGGRCALDGVHRRGHGGRGPRSPGAVPRRRGRGHGGLRGGAACRVAAVPPSIDRDISNHNPDRSFRGYVLRPLPVTRNRDARRFRRSPSDSPITSPARQARTILCMILGMSNPD